MNFNFGKYLFVDDLDFDFKKYSKPPITIKYISMNILIKLNNEN